LSVFTKKQDQISPCLSSKNNKIWLYAKGSITQCLLATASDRAVGCSA